MPDSDSPLGDRLEKLMQAETFPPPADFAARARVRDAGVSIAYHASSRLQGSSNLTDGRCDTSSPLQNP